MHRMRILYFSSFGSIKGGGQKSLLLLFEHIDKNRFIPICITPNRGVFVDHLKKRGIINYIIPMGPTKSSNLPRIIRTILKVYNIIKKERIDVVHTDGPRNTFYAGMASKLARRPVITHVRVMDKARFDDKIMALFTDHFIFVSRAAKKRFDWTTDKKPSTIIYNGIDVEAFEKYRSNSIPEYNENRGKEYFRIGCIGRVEKAKGQIYLIRAAKKVLITFPNCNFTFIGETDKEYLEQLMEEASSIEGNITFTGYLDDPYEVMKEMDIIVLPSLSEGFSRVILESMAMKKPVIATDVGGNPEAIIEGQTGYLVGVRDPNAISSRIIELLENRVKRIEIGEAGYQRANDLFRPEINIKQAEELYDMVLTN